MDALTPHDAVAPASRAADSGASASARIRSVIAGSLGNLVEWYDFYCYSAFSLYFARAFFPAQDPVAQMMSTAGIFALGFFVRPLGGWLFGAIADTYGRRRALMGSVLLMGLGSLLIAVTPGHDTLGAAAPAVLMAARLMQGLSLGGEYGASATYLAEVASGPRRGFFTSFQYVTLIGGQLLALILLAVMQQWLLTDAQLRAWGWRVAFALGAILAFGSLLLRRQLPETEAFLTEARQAGPRRLRGKVAALLKFPRETLTVIGMTMGGTLAFYVYTTYMQKFLRLSAGLDDAQSTLVSAASLLFAMILQPIYGALSDRVGRKPLLVAFGVLGCAGTVPLMTAISHARGPWEAFLLIACAWLIVSGYTSSNAVVKAELFPAQVRATGVALPYAIAVSVFGGSAEYLALWFKSVGSESAFYWYVTGVIACTLIVTLRMPDTRTESRFES